MGMNGGIHAASRLISIRILQAFFFTRPAIQSDEHCRELSPKPWSARDGATEPYRDVFTGVFWRGLPTVFSPLFDSDSVLKAKLADQPSQYFNAWIKLGQLYKFIALVRLIDGPGTHDQGFQAEVSKGGTPSKSGSNSRDSSLRSATGWTLLRMAWRRDSIFMPGNGRKSKCSSHWAQMRLGLSPPWMQPRFRVGNCTSKFGFRYFSCHSDRRASSSVSASCMPSMALRPRAGLEEWPDWPSNFRRSIMMPLCMRTGFRLVGSPMTA